MKQIDSPSKTEQDISYEGEEISFHESLTSTSDDCDSFSSLDDFALRWTLFEQAEQHYGNEEVRSLESTQNRLLEIVAATKQAEVESKRNPLERFFVTKILRETSKKTNRDNQKEDLRSELLAFQKKM